MILQGLVVKDSGGERGDGEDACAETRAKTASLWWENASLYAEEGRVFIELQTGNHNSRLCYSREAFESWEEIAIHMGDV